MGGGTVHPVGTEQSCSLESPHLYQADWKALLKKEMEICEDMVVDLNVVNMRKRQCMDAVIDHPLNKRTCQELESFANGNDVLLNDYDMVYWQAEVAPSTREPVNGFVPNGGIQQHCMTPQNPQNVSPQICLRCIAGESGHINHILRL